MQNNIDVQITVIYTSIKGLPLIFLFYLLLYVKIKK